MDNFWKYVTIVFTNYFAGKFENLEEKRERTDKSFRNCFKELIEKACVEEAIIKIDINDLRIKYIDLYDPDKFEPKLKEDVIKSNKKYLDSLKTIFIELSKQEPLFSKIEEKIVDNQKVVNRISYSKANLYICKIKKFLYYNQEGKVIKDKGIILDKKYDKDIELNRLKDHSFRAFVTSMGAYAATVACGIGCFVFPPAAPALAAVGVACYATGASATAVQIGTTISDAVENHTFRNTDDISKYED